MSVGAVAPDRESLARQTARRTRRNLIADGALAVATGATLLLVLTILVVILFDVLRHGTPTVRPASCCAV